MKRSYPSGSEKRKKKREADDRAKKLPKITSFFLEETETLHEEIVVDSIHPSSAEARPNNNSDSEYSCDKTVNNDFDATENIQASSSNSHNESNRDKQSCNITSYDLGLWNELSETDIAFWIEKDPADCTHSEGPFQKSQRVFQNIARYCTKNMFVGTKGNGETFKRTWLAYSPSTGRLYCFVCKLFCPNTSLLAGDGFNDWRNPNGITHHENSEQHRRALLTFLSRRQRKGNLDSQLSSQIETERHYWREVLRRVIAVICTLAERGLAFRGNKESFGSPDNGNYLGLLELIANFDPFLKHHIEQYGNCGTGKTSYLSKTICNEIVHLMAEKLRQSIIEDVKVARYFSLSVDSTPDLSHVDQLTVIIRYVSPENGKPLERFLTFLELQGHTGEMLANTTLNYFEKCGIDFQNCRGQSYDNAANMSGRYKGMQVKLREINEYADYIPCSAHSLNLVGRAAVDSCLEAVKFFAIVQETYKFYSASTHRWALLERSIGAKSLNLKSLSDTRWNCHAEAVSAVDQSFDDIVDSLRRISENKEEKGDTRLEACSIADKMETLEFVFMLKFWKYILEEFHKVSKTLQDPKTTITACSNLYSTLITFVQDTRNQFEYMEQKAKEVLPNIDYKSGMSRKRRRKRQDNDANSADAIENGTPKNNFRITSFIPIIDSLLQNLETRSIGYRSISDMFSFLINMETRQSVASNVKQLLNKYPNDFNTDFTAEILNFFTYVKDTYPNTKFNHEGLFQVIFNDNLSLAFPNVETSLRIYLSLMISNSTGERSFSKLKRIKDYLRTTMFQEMLADLSIMSMEHDKLRHLQFQVIIDQFSAEKSRKKIM